MLNRARALSRKMSTKATSTISNTINSTAQCVPPLEYKVLAKCATTKARIGVMTLRHGCVDTPVFMPVGTQVFRICQIKFVDKFYYWHFICLLSFIRAL